eukprot:gene4248-4813_t
MQSLIYHDVIGKRVAALEQMRKGLKMLGVLQVVQSNPQIFEPLFVFREKQITADTLQEKLSFPNLNTDYQDAYNHFIRYLKNASSKELEMFVQFCTGSKMLPMQRIKVLFGGNSGFFSSTCLLQITIPAGFKSYEEFSVAVHSVVCESKIALTSV